MTKLTSKTHAMKKSLRFILALTLLISGSSLFSQLEYGAFNATGSAYTVSSLTDYQCLGINPANLGWKHNNHSYNLGIFEMGISIFTEPLTKKQIFNDLMGNANPFSTQAERDAAIKNFDNKRLYMSGSATLLGFSFQKEKIGGFALTVRQRVRWNNKLNLTASEFLFDGYNAPYFELIPDSIAATGDTIGYAKVPQKASLLYHPSEMSHIMYTEYVLGYGRKLVDKDNFKFYAGVDIKYLRGYGMLQYNSISTNQAEGYQALSPGYGVSYNEPTPSQMSGGGLQTAGSGFGFDIGLSFEVYKKTKIALSVIDIGSITWDGNVYEGENTDIMIMESAGINSYDIFGESDGILSDNTNFGSWNGLAEKRVKLPMHLRFGAHHQLNEKFEFGTEYYHCLQKEVPGALEESIFALGAKYNPASWVQISTGVTIGGYVGWDIPFGLVFKPLEKSGNTNWELGFAFRDVTSLFTSKDPTISLAFGLLRFSFGQKEGEQRLLDE